MKDLSGHTHTQTTPPCWKNFVVTLWLETTKIMLSLCSLCTKYSVTQGSVMHPVWKGVIAMLCPF